MKRRKRLLRFIFGAPLFVCILLNSCANEDFIIDKNQWNDVVTLGENDILKVDMAKSWYSTNREPVCELRAANDSKGILIKPWWKHAKEWKRGKHEVVETDLISQAVILFYDKETSEKADWKNDSKIKNVGRMVFIKDPKTGIINNYIMVIVGSYEYLKDKKNKISRNNYLYREPKFDGRVLFFKPDGGFINGWTYEKGKITRELTPSNSTNDLPIFTRSTVRICITVTQWWAFYECPLSTYWSYLPEFGNASGTLTRTFLRTVQEGDCTWDFQSMSFTSCEYYNIEEDGEGGGGGVPGGVVPGNPDPDPNTVYTATLSNGNSFIDVGDEYSFTLEVTPAATISNVKFKIAYTGNMDQQSWILKDGTSLDCFETSLKPGNWDVMATVTLSDNRTINSNIESITVQYPHVYTIVTNPTVVNHMNSVWDLIKIDAMSSAGRREIGFWIYIDIIVNQSNTSITYNIGLPMSYGNPAPCDSLCRMTVSSSHISPSNSPLEGGRYAVAFFHAHPPLTYCPYAPPKGVGPSDSDIRQANEKKCPGILYDYEGINNNGFHYIYGGHDVNMEKEIHGFGYDRRELE